MKARKRRPSPQPAPRPAADERKPTGSNPRRWLAFAVAGLLVTAGVGAMVWRTFQTRAGSRSRVVHSGPVTFNKDIAPIIFGHCAGCHRPGQSAPFNLLTYEEVRKRSRQIVEVTERRYMPPWLPEPGCGDFADVRRLSDDELGLLRSWQAQGTPEGSVADLPALPRWTEGWQLGEPDLVVTMPEPYLLAAEGSDVYRNFVIPIPLAQARHVRAVEFRPGNWKVVHHAFLKFDASRDSRHRDEAEPGPGFDGIHAPPNAQPPSGHFLSWQPGKVVSKSGEGLAWRLEKDTDLVLQLHLRPTGKPESLQSSVGFYFTDQAPTKTPVKVWMNSYAIDIPAGERNYVLEQSYRLPADVDVLAVLPHAHYLGQRLEAEAILPDGTRRCLIRIGDWDFNWQGDYQYAPPLFLPKGTNIRMRFTYDNSAGNPRNPHHPPQRVRYGLQSTDEMGELWLQLLPRTPEGLEAIRRDNESRLLENSISYNQYLLKLNPRDAKAGVGLGRALLLQRRVDEAVETFQSAALADPALDEPHYYLGVAFRTQRKSDAARAEFERALEINPANSRAHGNLGVILMEKGDLIPAEAHFRNALRLDPADALARENLERILAARGTPRPKQ